MMMTKMMKLLELPKMMKLLKLPKMMKLLKLLTLELMKTFF